jgi:hypothetical protein
LFKRSSGDGESNEFFAALGSRQRRPGGEIMPAKFDITLNSTMPGSSWAGLWRDNLARPLITDKYGIPLKGGVTIDPEVQEIQPDEFHPPVRHLRLRVDLPGLGKPYEILVPVSSINGKKADFVTTMQEQVLPDGVRISDGLRDAMIAASFAPEVWKVHDREFASTETGMWENGRQLSNVSFCICDDAQNEYGARAYVLRLADGKRVTISAHDLQSGNYSYLIGPDARIFDPLAVYMQLKRVWGELSDQEKQAFRDEEVQMRQAEAVRQYQAQVERERRDRWRVR